MVIGSEKSFGKRKNPALPLNESLLRKSKQPPDAATNFMKKDFLVILTAGLVLFPPSSIVRASTANSGSSTSEVKSPDDPEKLFQEARRIIKDPSPTKDVAKAMELMKNAAATGHAEALGGLGYFYAYGVVVEKDEARAVQCFTEGAEKGAAFAQLNLGRMLAFGKGVAKNEELGMVWIRRAADQNLSEAVAALGDIAYEGKFGQKKDLEAAFNYHLRAAELGNVLSQNTVGVYLRDGFGVGPDEKKALAWFRKAAGQGDPKGQSNLGHLIGVEGKDRVEALKWLFIAQAQGEANAVHTLEEILPAIPKDEVEKARQAATTSK